MPPQIDDTRAFDESKTIEQSLPDYNQNVTRIRLHLLILLFIQWLVFFVTLGVGIYSIIIGNAVDVSSGIQSLISIIVLAIYYSFGLLVTYKYNRVGLLIFAWLGVILFIVSSILIGYIILAIVALSVGFGSTNQVYVYTLIGGLIFAVMATVVIMTIKFAFDLAKLIKTNEYLNV